MSVYSVVSFANNISVADNVEFQKQPSVTVADAIETQGIEAEDLFLAIEEAYKSISGDVIRTPTVRLPWLDAPGREVWAKLESQQHSGSFKYRGAINALRRSASKVVITASAGNHALAVAAAGKRVGKEVQVIAPTNASELKVNRLMNDANVTLLGKDLHEATKIAQTLESAAKRNGQDLYYVSPYANFDVAAGAGTMMIEASEDAGVFDTVVLPLGGGGLAAAIGAWCSIKSPTTKVVCTHPEIFGRQFDGQTKISDQLSRPINPTLSDGLGVQLVEETPFEGILESTISSVEQISESVTAASIAYILRLQSLLIEGASATTIGALMNGVGSLNNCKGRVLLILTGGNVASAAVGRALVADAQILPTVRS